MRFRSDVDQSRFGNSVLPFAVFVRWMETFRQVTTSETFGNDDSWFESILDRFLSKHVSYMMVFEC
ncbi:MAG: hypothetical protein CMO10_16735 [Thalassospira sp.]|nr:hypothetical protein [Thalassospira sp.]